MNDDELYEQIAKHQYKYNYTSPWEHLAPTPRKILAQAARNTMEPILARVRRDAAREALDGLIADKAHMTALLRAENGGNVEDVLAHYRDTHYPEETP